MSITYEEALETLENMFASPWSRETLDAVLRHHKGHMENTVESILQHGNNSPEELVKQLKEGSKTESIDLDQQLARQLAQEEKARSKVPPKSAPKQNEIKKSEPKKKTRGTPADLPEDFLRIPGFGGRGGQMEGAAMDQDEALARMLQDELFSQELANNPEFAHLARQRGAQGTRDSRVRDSAPHHASAAGFSEPPKIMEKISEMGQETKKKLQLLAAQWNTQWSANKFGLGTKDASASTSGPGVAGSNETRGLLDDDDDGDEMELSFAGINSPGKKTQ
eukprot:CAMPEP_0194227784 /NCGR_PEP_ID=MMETSP0156-20130528/43035_1 /TAXON_ID=33649 /ORGANISM="Thalassionema nitzschioides, Strain L26-B" /LENGTH=278 /DNA_ID=CAMNT_0038960277 /DNA_START=66 /DNA_END=902 /DNA_ORIENTATION=-